MKARFGDFSLDTDLRQLWDSSRELHVSPKAFELLLLLIEHRSRVLSKAELQERLWPDTFVAETNLASLIAELRVVLNDDAKHPRFVRTVHRFGYAFCGTVKEVSEQAIASGRAPQVCWLLKDGRRIPLGEGENILGRHVEGAIQIDSPSVSRRHARICVSDREVTIEDLSSKNGTYLNGQRLSGTSRLTDGDEVRIGSVVLQFRQGAGPGSTMTVTSGKGS